MAAAAWLAAAGAGERRGSPTAAQESLERAMTMATDDPGKQEAEMTAGRLLGLCESIYTSFNPSALTLDAHADTFLSEKKISNEDDAVFVRQVFYGTVRYKRLIQALLAAFYHKNSGAALRADANLYSVFAYLALFRLEELTFSMFRKLVASQEPQKMYVFLHFMFTTDNLRNFCRDSWLKLYDKVFVDDLIECVALWQEESADLLNGLESRVFIANSKSGERKATTGRARPAPKSTKPQPFKLTKPKPKPPPLPEPEPEPYRAKPAPKLDEGPTAEERAIEAARELNRRKIEALRQDQQRLVFKLRVTERPSKLPQLVAAERKRQKEESAYRPVKPKPVPRPPSAEVRLNAAAILREDAVYRKKQAEEMAALKAYEAELRDAKAFETWQAEMLARDQQARLEEVEERRQEMARGQQAAAEARERKVSENQSLAADMKEERERAAQRVEAEREEEVERNRQRAAEIAEERANVARQQEAVLTQNRELAEEERRKREANARRLAEQQAEEMRLKKDLIMQLRAMERAREAHQKQVDPTWTPNLGLLDEMSLVELRERMVVEREREREAEEERRARIKRQKEAKQSTLMAKAANITRIRKLANAQAALRRRRREEDAATSAASESRRKDAQTLELSDRIKERKAALEAEKARLAAEQKRIKFEQAQQAASADAVEESKFAELRAGAERIVRNTQATVKGEDELYEATMARQRSIKIDNQRMAQAQREALLTDYDLKMRDMKQRKAQDDAKDLTRKKDMVRSQREFENTLREKKTLPRATRA
ncbi:unnamed protein product [Pedinophyceae sp. YPF-701]|nr:unnamed protein product [Pedinophyceae sp. YPF-701]